MILVIEDDRTLANLLKYYLENIKKQRVLTAQDVRSALSLIDGDDCPSIVFLDYWLQGQTPEEIVKKCQDKWNGNTKLVLMTAWARAAQVQEELKIPFLLKKPFLLEDLDKHLSE